LEKLQTALALTPQDRRHSAIDIGAHVGLWSRVLAKHFRWVHAFEPLKAHLNCLQANVADTSGNVLIYGNIALGSMMHAHSLIEVKENSGNTRLATIREAVTEGSGITVYRFDDLWEADIYDPIDFMKIDVEGYELEVVRGAEQAIKRNKPVMVVEQKKGNAERFGFKTGDVIDLLRSWGANVRWVRSGDYCLTWS
jgi:FkbM family methyltransferase